MRMSALPERHHSHAAKIEMGAGEAIRPQKGQVYRRNSAGERDTCCLHPGIAVREQGSSTRTTKEHAGRISQFDQSVRVEKVNIRSDSMRA